MRLLLLIGLLLPLVAEAQHQLGWRTDTYAGINSALLNPAAPIRTPYQWDLNLAEVGQFFDNNYAYLVDASWPGLLRDASEDTEFFFREDLPSDISTDENVVVFDFAQDQRKRFIQSHTSVLGPSLSVQVAPMTRIGILTRWQTMVSAKGLDNNLSFYDWRDAPNNEDININPFRTSVASWSEVGLNIAQGIPTATGQLTIGLTARRLWGQRAAYFVNDDPFLVAKLNQQEGVEGASFDFDTGYSDNFFDDEISTRSPGSGWAADLGVLYQLDLGDDFYRWEFGFSVMDIGRLQFDEGKTHRFASEELTTVLSDDYEVFQYEDGIDAVIAQFSEDVFQDPAASLVSGDMRLRLPTTLSLQASYAFTEWARLEGVLATGLAPAGPSLDRSLLIGLTPRIDRYWWSVAMPVSLYAGEHLRMGLSARLGPLFIGTDQLGSFLRQDELQGGDIYVGFKWFPLGLQKKNKGRRTSRGRRGRGKDVECYKF